jgi:hypothetical protein
MGNGIHSRNGTGESPEGAEPSPGAAENPVEGAEPLPGDAENLAEVAESPVDGAKLGAREDFAGELRSWRVKRGLTQVALARRSTIPDRTCPTSSDAPGCQRSPSPRGAIANWICRAHWSASSGGSAWSRSRAGSPRSFRSRPRRPGSRAGICDACPDCGKPRTTRVP